MMTVKKKRLIFSFLLVSTLGAQAQVGVNTVTPKSTLHVLPSTTGSATAEGIIAPNLTRAQLIAKDAKYTDTERGAIVYVTDLSGILSAKTSKVTQAGYYFFDGSVWQQFASSMPTVSPAPWQVQGGTTQATDNSQNIYQTGKVAIGTGSTAVSGSNLEVAGTSYVSGNSKVGSSTVVGNETVGGTLAVTGATTIGSGGSLTLAGNGAAANKYLVSDANGKGTWQSLPAVATSQPWRVQGGATLATDNSQHIYQAGKVAIGIGSTAVSGSNLEVAGTSYVSGNSKVGSSTVVGNETVGGTLGVTGATTLGNALTVGGTTNTKATNITGTLNYKPTGTAPAANTYLRTDASGNASWQALPVVATTEPWQVQGGSTLATTNAQNIYQTGSVGIGANTAVPVAYKFQVTGASNITGNSRVASSTVVGAQTIGTTLSVTTTSTLTGKVGIGRTPATGSYILAMQGNSYQSGNGYVSGSIKMGGDETFNTSAQLELKDANKGFLPNRVALTGATDKTTIPGVVDGMIVYNTRTINGMSPGVYFWKNNSWNRFVDEIPQSTLFIRDLQQSCTSVSNDANNTAKGALMNFGTLTIPEDGSYSFTFRLYGTLNTRPTAVGTQIYYIALMLGNTIKDTAEMDIIAAPTSGVLTYSITLGAQFKAGDAVSFRLSNLARSLPWSLINRPGQIRADRTSLVWSKL